MNTTVHFKSKAFPKYPNEDAEIVNANCWGKRLAEFIRDGLPRFGVETTGILNEDWGWLVSVRNDAFPLGIGCGPVDDSEEEDGGKPADGTTEFVVFVTAEPKLLQRLFKRVDTKPALERAAAALRGLLESSPDIADIVWSDDPRPR
jgi:hypothetical protein